MARTDAVIVVQTRHIALRTLLAVMLAITLALSMIVPSGGAPAAAEETSGADDPFDGLGDLGDLIRVESVAFVDQPVDAVLDDGSYPVTATPSGSTENPVTVEWTYSRTATFHQATDRATELLRSHAVELLLAELDAVVSETFETSEFTSGTTATIADEFFSPAASDTITTDYVADHLALAVAEAIQVATPGLVTSDIATTPTTLTSTPTASTTVDTATATTPTVTTRFDPLEVQGPETRRSVQLDFDVPSSISVKPSWQFEISVAVPLTTQTTGTETTVVLADPSTSTTPTTVTIDTTVSLDDLPLATELWGQQASDEFSLWETSGDCGENGSCEADIRGDVPHTDDDVRVTVRGTDDENGEGTLLLGWLGNREFPGESFDQCGPNTYQGLPGTILFDVAGNLEGEKLVTVQVPRSIVQRDTNNGRAQYDVCFLGEAGLTERDARSSTGAPTTTTASGPDDNGPYLLPNCGLNEDGTSNAPCIESRTAVRSVGSLPREWRSTLRGGLEIAIRLPAEDPMFR